MTNLEKGSPKLLNAWAFYDWANSVYTLVISSTIFPIYYGALFRAKGIEEVQLFGFLIRSEALISYVTALGFLIIAFISPLLSGIADFLGNKKFFLKLFCYVGAISCMSLYFFEYFSNLVILSSSGINGLKGNLKNECIVCPPTLMAAIPVKAQSNIFLRVFLAKYWINVDFPVPALPVI